MYVGPVSRFVAITQSYVELLLQSSQFAECHRTLHFHHTHKSLSTTRSQEHKRAWLKVEKGLLLDLEARRRSYEEEDNKKLEAEEQARLVEEARLKDEEEEEEYTRLEAL